MTCVVGFIADDGIYIGADSAGTNSDLKQRTRLDKKVFINGEFIIGFTSSFRMGQLIQYKFTPPKYIFEMHGDVFQYMCTQFVDSLRQCLKDGGYAQNDKGEECGGYFLVGFKGRLFSVQGDYQVAETVDNYDSCGCGEEFALGSLFLLSKSDDVAENIVKQALSSAEYFSAGVRGPFTILKLTTKELVKNDIPTATR